ncbi:o-succinylbenzoate synthase [Flavicella sediminum]|uniref:o-succinylbenzoate synthase n=1 Tax=Flavicella sediminum TaxID=2585141 RepID=UPI00112289B1|nr:o-succinylbenzoate synthase [Flavicella sediminum]
MLKASYKKHLLEFKQASGTSRGILKTKETFFIQLFKNEKKGIGECGLFRGLSADDRPDYEEKLAWTCRNIELGLAALLVELKEFPSIQFGLEQAFLSLERSNPFELFPSDFVHKNQPISINGLIWMGDAKFMQTQIEEKLKQGFHTIKLKIGAINFDKECELLQSIRKRYNSNEIELRVDANGAFAPKEALEKLKKLSDYDLHSIEQPIKQGQADEMAQLCANTPLAIALDEELIGVFEKNEKEKLIEHIQPQYIILKPSLVGGIKGSNEWIEIAKKNNIDWWITSALESNIGLNAIAQWTAHLKTTMPQGLGTGGLFTNNFNSPLYVDKGALWYGNSNEWDFKL